MILRKSCPVVGLLALAAAHAATAHAQTLVRWARPVSGDYFTASNWSPAVTPSQNNFSLPATHDVLIDVAGTYTVSGPANWLARPRSVTVAATGATLQVSRVSMPGSVVVSAGSLFVEEVTAASVVNAGAGTVLVGRPDWTLDVAEFGGTLTALGSIPRATVTLRPDAHLSTSQLRFFVPAASSGVRRLDGSGTVTLRGGTLTAVNETTPAPRPAPVVEVAEGITLRFQPTTNLSLPNTSFALSNLDFRGTLLTDFPTNAALGNASFSGVNRGTVRGVNANALASFSGANHGVLDLAAPVSTTRNLTLAGPFTNTASASFARLNVTLDGAPSLAPGSSLTVTDGSLTLLSTGSANPGTFTATGLASVTRVNSRLDVAAPLEGQGTTLTATASAPIRLFHALRSATVSGPDGALVIPASVNASPERALDAVTLDTPVNLVSTTLPVRNGLTLLRDFHLGPTSNFANFTTGTHLRLEGTQTLAGPATVTFSGRLSTTGGSYNAGLLVSVGSTVTLGPDLAFRILPNTPAVIGHTNQTAPGLQAVPASNNTVVFQGRLSVPATSVLELSTSAFVNQGSVSLDTGGTLLLRHAHLATLGDFTRAPGATVRLVNRIDLPGQALDLSTSPAGPLDLDLVTVNAARLVSPGRTVTVGNFYAGGSTASATVAFTGTALAADLSISNVRLTGTYSLDNATITATGNARLAPADGTLAGTGTVRGAALSGTNHVELRHLGPGVRLVVPPTAHLRVQDPNNGPPRLLRVDASVAVEGGSVDFGGSVSPHDVITQAGPASVSSGGTLTYLGHTTVAPSGSIHAFRGHLGVSGGRLHNLGFVRVDPDATLVLNTPLSGLPVDLRGALRATTWLNPSTFLNAPVPVLTTPVLHPTSVVELGAGNIEGSSARLAFSQPLVADGTLLFFRQQFAQPLPGITLTLATYPSISGSFDAFAFRDFLPGYRFAPSVNAASITLTLSAVPGDANLDDLINTLDLDILAASYNRTGRNWFTADFTRDARTDIQDLYLLMSNWSGTQASLFAALTARNLPIPEPAALSLLALPLAVLTRRRR